MRRRQFIATSVATLCLPHIARAEARASLRFVPAADIPALDPVWTTASQTRDHAMLVYDTLYGLDDTLRPQPQMVDGHVISPDGLVWTLKLRDGLMFHDGSRVLARDCVASIRRWGARDSFGQLLLSVTDALGAPDDRTIEFRLKRPFALVADALAKTSSPCVIMPERLALTDPFKAVTDPTGSGPYRFLADERVAGAHLGYARFDGYVPRPSGTPQGTSGPKIAYIPHVEWVIMPDGSTAASALANGEVDWLRWPLVDLVPKLRKTAGVTVKVIEPMGLIGMLRFNHLHPPFDNPAVRRAILPALPQVDYMTSASGEDTTLWRSDVGYFTPGTAMASDAGLQALTAPRDMALARRLLKESGYSGARTVVMQPTDFPIYNAMSLVTGQLLREIGFNVDVQAMDWATAMQRRAKSEPVEQGGWSVFHTGWGGPEQATPVSNIWLRGNGIAGAPGWPTSAKLEDLRDAWLRAPDQTEQKRIAAAIQAQAFVDVPYVPLGQIFTPVAHRSDLSGMLNGLPLFWNIRRG